MYLFFTKGRGTPDDQRYQYVQKVLQLALNKNQNKEFIGDFWNLKAPVKT